MQWDQKCTKTHLKIILSAFYADQFPNPQLFTVCLFCLFNCLFNSSFVFDLQNAETKAGKVQISFYFYLMCPKIRFNDSSNFIYSKRCNPNYEWQIGMFHCIDYSHTHKITIVLFLFKLIKSDFFLPWNRNQSPNAWHNFMVQYFCTFYTHFA